ncbi:hypothetical protein [Roseovarius sp. MBR-6]|jgi:hypothetical protein|uniref:hypothetical protein n=1 Tax=Roseovarius sp. MBR-6 TaxID=3156459 RepID=UPI0033983D14
MTEQNDNQAQALIDALGPKLAEALLPALQKQVEEQIQGIVKKNDELLEKLSKSKDDPMSKLLAAADQQQRDRLNKDGTFRKEGEPVRLKRSDARNVKAYAAAKKLAADQGVNLEIVPDA